MTAPEPAPATPPYTKLSVNISAEAERALRDLMHRRGITATEAIRRAISVWKYIEDARDAGDTVYVGDDLEIREVIFHV